MKHHRDFRSELRLQLLRRYGALAARLRMTGSLPTDCGDDAHCLAQQIDNYCMSYADTANLSWHHCAAALTWFIGTSARTEEN